MYVAVNFQYQSVLDAQEIDHVAVNYILTPELESEYPAVAQDFPRASFRRCGALSEDPRAVSLPKGDPSTSGHFGRSAIHR
jgi:hypothetical protein